MKKKVSVGLLAGTIGGLLLGIGGRIAMRVIAIGAGIDGGFSLGGSAEVLATGLIMGTPAGLVYVVLRRYVPRSGLWTGAVFGALYFSMFVLIPPPAARSALDGVGHLPLSLSLFGPLFVTYGVVVEAIAGRFERVERNER